MAKRKRLTPARMTGGAPEVKSALDPKPARTPLASRPPIADVAHDAAASAALTEVAAELTAARDEQRLIQRLDLDTIDPTYLVRDRRDLDPDEMNALSDSIRARGQQTAIEVADLGDGQYGLISGYRRYLAIQNINANAAETESILAIIRHPEEAADAYLAMVEENEIRVGLSFYEKGRIVARAVDQGVYRADRTALPALFANVPRARRSKIGSFVTIVRALDDALRFPEGLTEKQGLALARALEADDALAPRITAALMDAAPKDAGAEWQVIERAMRPVASPASSAPPAKASPPKADENDLEITPLATGGITITGPQLRDAAFVRRLIKAVKAL